MPKTSSDQRKPFANSPEPRPVPLPARNNSFPHFNSPFRFFTEATNLQETQRNLARCGARHAGCSVHSSFPLNEKEKEKEGKRKGNSDEEDGKSKNKILKDSIPSFSSPWGPSSCSPKRVLWKEVEDYNRRRKRMRFLGWSGVEHPWETEGSSTVCSEWPDCSDADDPLRQAILSGVTVENQTTVAGQGSDGTKRGQDGNGIKVTITTSKDGTTTTTLEASANARLGNGVEIVTKTVVRGDAVTTVTTTALIPLAVSSLKRTTGD